MAVHDVIGDMLTQIRNIASAGHKKIICRFSNEKWAIVKILLDQGFLEHAEIAGTEEKKTIRMVLKYNDSEPVIAGLKRISSPGRRVYRKVADIPRFMNGLAVTIVSTSKGILTGKQAKEANQGGEVLCYIW